MHSINVTPLTDVLLVLLITFLLTATAFQADQQDVPLPRVVDAREVAERTTRVAIALDGEVRWPGGIMLGEANSAAFKRLKATSDRPILALAVHRELPYSSLYPVMAAAREAGWERIVLLTEAAP